LAAMGEWLKVNGESIYGVSRSPVGVLPNGRVTHRPFQKTLYFHVYDWPANGIAELPGIFNDISSARLLDGGKELTVTKPAQNMIQIKVPDQAPDPYANVIVLTYKGELKAEKLELEEN